MRRPNLRLIGVEEGKEYQLKGTVYIFNKIIEENFPTLKNKMTRSTKEAYRLQIEWTKKEILPDT